MQVTQRVILIAWSLCVDDVDNAMDISMFGNSSNTYGSCFFPLQKRPNSCRYHLVRLCCRRNYAITQRLSGLSPLGEGESEKSGRRSWPETLQVYLVYMIVEGIGDS